MVEKSQLRKEIITFCRQNHMGRDSSPCDNLLSDGTCMRSKTAGVDVQDMVVVSGGVCLYAEIDGESGTMTLDRGFIPESISG